MQYRTMPRSNEKLSALGFGCMRLPTRIGGMNSRFIDKDKALDQLAYAIDNGVNYLDTAYLYHLGASETFLGKHILSGEYREKVNIATKLPCNIIHQKGAIEEIFSKQLKRLQVDVIDYYLLHSLNGSEWKKMLSLGAISFMDRIRKEGRIRHMGFSFHGLHDDFIEIVDGYDWDFVQVQYNIIDEHFQAGIEGIEHAHRKGMGVIVMEPLRGGALAGRIPKEVLRLYEQAEVKRSPAEWALRWVWDNPAVTMILSGMNVLEHVKENIRIASDSFPGSMTSEERAFIDRVGGTYDSLFKVGCTGCGYCMPCPERINIPEALKSYNDYHLFSKGGARLTFASRLGVQSTDGKPHWTSSCTDCGECEEKCPQNIKIREEFKNVQRDLEKPGTKLLAALMRLFMNRRRRNIKSDRS